MFVVDLCFLMKCDGIVTELFVNSPNSYSTGTVIVCNIRNRQLEFECLLNAYTEELMLNV